MSKPIEERFPVDQALSCAYMDTIDDVNACNGDISSVQPRACLLGSCGVSEVYIVGLGENPPDDKYHVIAADVPSANAYKHPAFSWCARTRGTP